MIVRNIKNLYRTTLNKNKKCKKCGIKYVSDNETYCITCLKEKNKSGDTLDKYLNIIYNDNKYDSFEYKDKED